MAKFALSSNDRDRLMGSSYVSGNRHERMGGTLHTSAAENEARERKTKQVLFCKLCTRRQKLEHGASFLFQIAAKSSTASVSNESVLPSTSSDCTVVTFVSDEKIPRGRCRHIWVI